MSLLQIILFTLFSAIHAYEGTNVTDNDLTSRILYGMRANIKDYPYFAGIPGCGAAIISSRWLVTAAHCVEKVSSTIENRIVWVGGENMITSQLYAFDKVIIHPQYTYIHATVPVNDIALLRLTEPVKFGTTVKAITLPRQEYKRNAVHKFAGMGTDETGGLAKELMRVDLVTLEEKECLSHISPEIKKILRPYLHHLKKVVICTKRTEDLSGICYGDSGSGLVRNGILVGIASFLTVPEPTCQSNRLGMFTNVAPFVSWIKSKTGIK